MAKVEALIRKRVDQGCTAIHHAPVHPDAREALTDLAVKATRRTA